MKPVRLPAAATIALPRWSIIALCLLYILPGLIGRDPWKGADAAGFGIMWTMAYGSINDWLWPNIAGLAMPDQGPLAFWLGAIGIKLFGWLVGDPLAARISTAIAFLVGSTSVWYATYLLGRRAEAQPLKLAFGGQPEPKDFGRTLADGALLIYLGCLGLLLPSHTTSSDPVLLALFAYAIYLAVRLFDQPQKRIALQLGLTLGLLVLTRGFVLPVGIFISLILVSAYRQPKLIWQLSALTLPVATIITGAWLISIHQLQPYGSSPLTGWLAWNQRQIGLPQLASISYFFKYSIWFAWPAWPFAAWAIYAWRKQERALHICLPVGIFICVTLLAIVNNTHEEGYLLPLLAPLAILAAFGLPTMKRSAINAVDWFAVMIMTGTAAILWFGWFAATSGLPHKISLKILSWAPGYVAQFNAYTFIIALVITALWFRIVYWRISRQPSVLWRAVVLSSGGVILCWVIIMSLWLPLANHRVSYANVVQDMTKQITQPYRCIESNLGAPQRALFAYYGKVKFSSLDKPVCDLLLLQDKRRSKNKARAPKDNNFSGRWTLIWEGERAADNDEFFSLYRRK